MEEEEPVNMTSDLAQQLLITCGERLRVRSVGLTWCNVKIKGLSFCLPVRLHDSISEEGHHYLIFDL